MKSTRSLQRILIIGETHFVGRALIEKLFDENSQLECWLLDSTIYNHLSPQFHSRLHLLNFLNKESLLNAWFTFKWEAVLYIVSNYTENSLYYKSEREYQKSILGWVLREIANESVLQPLYVEIETDWVFSDLEGAIQKSIDKKEISYLEAYPHRISIDTTNILSVDMQSNHWIFNFIRTLKSSNRFGVPCDGVVLRDWISKEDYIEAICVILAKGEVGSQYTVVGFNEWTNYDLMLLIGATYDRLEIRENGVFKFKLCNEKISCRKSYKQTKIGLSFLSLHETFKPKSVYDIVDELIGVPLSLVTKG